MSVRNRFTNPVNAAIYDWPLNHSEEEASGKTRSITHTSPTSNVGLLKQQGDDTPYVLKWRGKILTRDQKNKMWDWYQLCQYQTIYLRDADNQSYEGQITVFNPRRIRKAEAVGRDSSMLNFYYEYEFEFEVYRFIGGDLGGRILP